MKTKRNYKLVQFKHCGDSYINHFNANNKYSKELNDIRIALSYLTDKHSRYYYDPYKDKYVDSTGNPVSEYSISTEEKIRQLNLAKEKLLFEGDSEILTYHYFISPMSGPFANNEFHIQLEYSPDYTGERNTGYWIGYVRNETLFEKSGGGYENNIWITFGFSEYRGTVKYIIESILRYLSGEKHLVYNGRGMLTPNMTDEDVENLKTENIHRKKEDLEEYKARVLAKVNAEVNDMMAELEQED